MNISLTELREITKNILTGHYGYDESEAQVIADALLYAQTRDNNQGIVKLTNPAIERKTSGPITVVKETKVSALLDGKQNNAMLVANRATDMAIAKAKEHGIAVVGAHGINSSSGALGYYMNKIAKQNLVGLLFVSAPSAVAMAGSYQALLGTNPLAIGVPGKKEPIVLDMATSAMALYGVIEANIAKKQLPEGAAFDKDGNPTTEPAKMLDGGALRTFDQSYKSSNLSLLVQILAGPLVGAAYMGEGDTVNNWAGALIIAIDPDILNGTEEVQNSVETIIKKVKSAKKLPGVEEIMLPGERGDRLAGQIAESGRIDIEDNLWAQLKELSTTS